MPLIVPYQSQAGIQTANGGPAAQYRSASAFMTPGQENLGKGMQQLAHGVGKLGDTLFQEEIRKRQEQLDLDVMRDIQSAMGQDAEWRAQYRNSNTGAGARDAEQHYSAFSGELSQPLIAKYQHNPRALRQIESRLGSLFLSGRDAMRGYADEQEKVYQGGLVADQKNLMGSVYANPNATSEERAQVVKDFQRLKFSQLTGTGIDPETAASLVNHEIREFDKTLVKERHAILRQTNPALAARISKAGAEGRVHVDPVAFVAEKESGKEGSLAIGYDKTGGSSYGTFQISSPTMRDGFIPWLEKNGHAAAAEDLRNAGGANAGGAMADTWRSLVRSGAITDDLQEQFIRETHLDPALRNAPEGFRQAVAASPIFEAAALSTAVQHGEKNAGKMLAEAWEISGGDAGTFLAALYEERKTRFPSSTPEMRKRVADRLDAERDELFRAGNSMLSPREWEPEHNKDVAEINRITSEVRKQGDAIVGDLANITTYAIEKNDFTAYREAENALSAMGRDREADKMRKVREIYETAAPFLASVAQAPFNERYAEIQKRFSVDSEHYTQENAAAMKEVREMATEAVNKEREAFERDPAGYVRKTQNTPVVDEESAAADSVEAGTRANMVWQKVLAGDAGFRAKPMTTEQANEFKTMLYDPEMNVNAKAERLAAMATAYGDLTPRVLGQIGADPAIYAAARLILDTGGDTTGTARMLLAAALTPDGQVPKDASITPADINDLIAKSEYMRYLAGVMRAFPMRGGLPADYRAVQDAAAKMIKLYGKESLAGLSTPYEFETDASARMYLRVPKQSGIDVDDAADALAWVRKNMKERVPGLTGENYQTIFLQGAWHNTGDMAVLSVDGQPVYSVSIRKAVDAVKKDFVSRGENYSLRGADFSLLGIPGNIVRSVQNSWREK